MGGGVKFGRREKFPGQDKKFFLKAFFRLYPDDATFQTQALNLDLEIKPLAKVAFPCHPPVFMGPMHGVGRFELARGAHAVP